MKPEKAQQQAVMTLEAGEEIAGMWITAPVPGSGWYKLIAKKKTDGRYEWAHFIHRPDGSRTVLMRGETETREQLDTVVEIANRNLSRIFGPAFTLMTAGVDVYSLEGKKGPPDIL
jgi:hypothetical protein